MTKERKLILDIDSPTRSQTKAALDQYFKQRPSGLITPAYVDKKCEGCGDYLKPGFSETYYGQQFCVGCVSKWKAGGK